MLTLNQSSLILSSTFHLRQVGVLLKIRPTAEFYGLMEMKKYFSIGDKGWIKYRNSLFSRFNVRKRLSGYLWSACRCISHGRRSQFKTVRCAPDDLSLREAPWILRVGGFVLASRKGDLPSSERFNRVFLCRIGSGSVAYLLWDFKTYRSFS